MESSLTHYTGVLNVLKTQGLGIPAVCLFLLKLRFLVPNRRQLCRIAKTNNWDSRDPTFHLVQMICDSISVELFPHL